MNKNKPFLNYLMPNNTYLKPEGFLFIGFWSGMFGLYFMNYYYAHNPRFEEALSLTVLNFWDIPIALIHFHLWLPKMMNLRNWSAFPILTWIGYLLGMVLLAWIDSFLFAETGNLWIKNLKSEITWQRNFPEAIISMLSYAAVMYAQRIAKEKNTLEWIRENMEKSYEHLLLKHEVADQEVQQLRFLIDRHTLLNMMDSIYLSKDLETAQEIALKVKSLMSYALKESDTRKVSLVSEIEILNAYIDLKKMEFMNRNVTIDLNVSNVEEHWKIAPFLLFVFVENVFKHGIHKLKNERWAKINIEMRGSELHFQTLNKEPAQNVEDMPDIERSGKGIRLTRRRLKTLYPEKHSLELKSNHNVFEAYLTIDLADTYFKD
jgi:Histidine kinase